MPPDIVESLWPILETMAEEERLFVSEEVKDELRRKDDGLYRWVMDHRHMVVPSVEVEEVTIPIIQEHSLVDPNTTRNQADPWVIGVALARNAHVVSSESFAHADARLVKIPDVCQALGVECHRHRDFLRHAGIRV